MISACNNSAGSSEVNSSNEPSSQQTTSSSDVSSSSEQKSSSSSKSSSKNSSSSSEKSSSSNASSSSQASPSNQISSSNQGSSSSQGGQSLSPEASPILPSDYELQNDPKTCDQHNIEPIIMFKANILSKGVKRMTCTNCGGYHEEFYYDFNECVFESKAFMYDGKERTLYVEGMVPYGVEVVYENNTQTEIGSHEATAKFYEKGNRTTPLQELKATISVVENIGIPEVRVTTTTGEDPNYKEKEQYTDMTCTTANCDSKWVIENKEGGIRVRGNSTNQASVNKRAWRLKFKKKTNLLGLNAGPDGKGFKSWVLMADNFDYSYFRNATAWNFGNDLFNYSGNYTTKFQHVNFYMNGDYRGIYLVAEQQQSNYGRIGIDEPQDDDELELQTAIKRGYLVEIDGLVTTGQTDEEYTFTTGNGSSGGWGGWGQQGDQIDGVTISDKGYVVKTDVYSEDQFNFIKKYINNVLTIFKDAVKGTKLQVLDEDANIIDSPYSTQYETLNAVMDLDSIFRTYVLQEFCKNYDCGWGSFYLFVDFSQSSTHKRLTCGAPWDFDLGLGNKKSDGHPKPDGDFILNSGGGFMGGGTEFNPWLFLLAKTNFFSEMFERYYSIFNNSATYEKAVQYINYESSAFADDFANEYAKWGGDSGRNSMGTRSYASHEEAVTYLTNWLGSRKEYLDNKYLK